MKLYWSTISMLLIAFLAGCRPPLAGPPPSSDQTYGFLIGRPVSRIVREGVLEVAFLTAEPTPPAVIYLGVNDIREELDYPRYRLHVFEPGAVHELRRRHRIEVDFTSLLELMPNTEFEPRICWRAEVYLPARRATRFVEGRQYFDPSTLGDTVNVTVGPFVEQVTATSAVITLETDRAAVVSAIVGQRSFRPNGNSPYEIHVTGLEPESGYEYRVQAGRTRVRPYHFHTAGGDSFRFAAMVDSREGVGGGMRNAHGVNAFSLYTLGSGAYHRGADFILFAGDLINGYTTSEDEFCNQLDSFRHALGPVHARIPIYEGMGNHESLVDLLPDGALRDKPGSASAEAVFAQVFCNPANGPPREQADTPTYAENVYSFDRSHARFFMLNNNYWFASNPARDGGNLEGFIMARQLDWLRRQVAHADEDDNVRLLFFAVQEPPFPNGGHSRDAMWYDGGDTNRDGRIDDADIAIVQNRNELWEIIAGSPKTVALITGDEHSYSRIRIQQDTPVGHRRKTDGSLAEFRHPVWQITTGGAGAPWYDKELTLPWSADLQAHSTQPHYAFFSVDGEQVGLDVYSQTGERIDSAELRRAPSAPVKQ